MSITPDFTSDKQEVLAGETVNFSDLSTGPASKWKWTFLGGDPASSDLSGPAAKYERSPAPMKRYTEISNAATSVTTKKTGFIKVGIKSAGGGFYCQQNNCVTGETITFTDKTTGIPSGWTGFRRKNRSAHYFLEQNPAIKFDIPGVYTVKLATTNPAYSGEKTVEKMITIIDITAVTRRVRCSEHSHYAGGEIQFEDETLKPLTGWSWTFDGGIPCLPVQNNIQNKIQYTRQVQSKACCQQYNTQFHWRSAKGYPGGCRNRSDRLLSPFNNNYAKWAQVMRPLLKQEPVGFGNADRKG